MTNKELDDKLRAMGKDPNDPLGFNSSTAGKTFYWLTEGIWAVIALLCGALGFIGWIYNLIF